MAHEWVKLRSDDEDGTCPFPNFFTAPAVGCLMPTYDLACNRPNIRWIFSGIGFEPGTLRSRHAIRERLIQESTVVQLS
ncbi:hypothetical protein AVEN_116996-1 [Araneus ventricosus]|uniref:Uncharacterized protein n=1 Tax=Araneus ventricosus TaxID=182803 RepID=A0A4Y2ME78_ARAVE|nr:hypothetical protein AVEN_116996-1 [Araneus ventricosus]